MNRKGTGQISFDENSIFIRTIFIWGHQFLLVGFVFAFIYWYCSLVFSTCLLCPLFQQLGLAVSHHAFVLHFSCFLGYYYETGTIGCNQCFYIWVTYTVKTVFMLLYDCFCDHFAFLDFNPIMIQLITTLQRSRSRVLCSICQRLQQNKK